MSRAGVQFGPSASVGRRISLRACISRRIRYNKCVYSIDRGRSHENTSHSEYRKPRLVRRGRPRDENVDLYAENGVIRAIGQNLAKAADETIDARHMLCYPGLINTHHHLYQQFSRNLPQVQNMELFDWLKTLYEIWKNLDENVIRLSSLTGMGELMKHGCTTCFDHHYVFPAGAGDLIGTQFEAASELGIRMHCSRGSMDLSVKDGGLPPDSVVQTVDEIMKDSARLIETYHDASFGSMRQVALAPCSPFSVSAELLRQSAILARQYHVRLHTHLCETKDEETYMLEREGMRPLAFMQTLGCGPGRVVRARNSF